MDFIINHTICKHMHLVASNTFPNTSTKVSQPVPISEPKIVNESSPQDKLRKIKDRVHQTLSKIHVCMETCKSEHDLLMVESHISSAVQILELSLKTKPTYKFPGLTQAQPSNAKIQTQRFQSTRKRPKTQTTRLTKPSLKEKLVIVEFLTKGIPLYEVSKTHAEENKGKVQLHNQFIRLNYFCFT